VFQLYCFIFHTCADTQEHPLNNSFEPIMKTTWVDENGCFGAIGERNRLLLRVDVVLSHDIGRGEPDHITGADNIPVGVGCGVCGVTSRCIVSD
jgi:hypothetical protein